MKTGKWLYIDRLINNLCPMRLRMKIYRAAGMEIGESVSLAYGIHFDNPAAVTIGHHTNVNKFTMFYTGDPLTAHITVGNYVDIASDVKILCHSHVIGTDPEDRRAGKVTYESVSIGDYSWIGLGVTIMPGVHIGRGCVIGAGSLVTKDTEDNSLYVGSPARKVRDL